MEWNDKRNQLLAPLRETQLELRPPRRQQHDLNSRRELRNKFDMLLAEYVENVPYVAVSRCPVCGQSLELVIDVAGLDSPWWWDQCPQEFASPKACDHYQVFLGAVDFHGREPAEVDTWGVLPGPGAPYVIERMLAMDGMQAVVSAIKIGANLTGYLIVYFSSEPVSPNDLHQEWRRQTWVVYDDDGNGIARDLVNDPWDFELGPWLESGKLLWTQPGDESLALQKGRPSPYEDLPGTRKKQIIGSGKLKLGAPPDGTEPEYYAPY